MDNSLYLLLKEMKKDIRELRLFVEEHMKDEEKKISQIDKRLSKIEWQSKAAATAIATFVSTLFAYFK